MRHFVKKISVWIGKIIWIVTINGIICQEIENINLFLIEWTFPPFSEIFLRTEEQLFLKWPTVWGLSSCWGSSPICFAKRVSS